jgi:hypothetical protein
LELDELQHALAITGHCGDAEFTPSEKFLANRLVGEIEKRIINCCGNLIEIKKSRMYQPWMPQFEIYVFVDNF